VSRPDDRPPAPIQAQDGRQAERAPAPADRSPSGHDQDGNEAPPPRSTFISDLRAVLSERDFRKLFATRLTSQFGDGMFTAGLGTYVFFNATTFPNPASAAGAFVVLYLPYSLVGPFAGVFIDRWSRRQILVYSALLRTVFAAVTALLVASGTLGVPLYLGALLVLGLNRFFLSALSAALPHVVPEDKLVMANSVAPTSGTIVGFIGGLAGTGVHIFTGSGQSGSAATLALVGVCYLASAAAGRRMPKDLLGPKQDPGMSGRRAIGSEFGIVLQGLAAGLRHVGRRRPAAAALFATACHRLLYGILALMSILLYRNYFYRHVSANASLKHYALVLISSAIGYGLAAVLTPPATSRITKTAWITLLLAAGGILTGLLGASFTQVGFIIVGFVLGVVAQGVAISTTTIIQETVDDEFRGRVFSINDMLYNTTFVAGAAICAGVLPITGKSYAMLAVVAVGYLAGAVGYRLLSGQPPDGLDPPGLADSGPAEPGTGESATGWSSPAGSGS
jgi:MFS family permease